MFNGTIPGDMRSIVLEHARQWPTGSEVHVGCSGNLTIERTLAPLGHRLHSNDVNPYSCALGWFFAGQPVPYRLKDDAREELEWLEPSLDDGAGTMATLMLGTRFLQFVGKTGRYHRRMVAATREQWPHMHAKTMAKLEAATLRLATFYPGDVREFVDQAPPGAAVVAFPPFFSGDYESMFDGIDRFFDWPAPEWPDLTEDGKDALLRGVMDRDHWLLGLHVERPELHRFVRGKVQTSNRGTPIFLYASDGPRRIVVPRQPIEQVRMPKIRPDSDLMSGEMKIHPLTGGQFSTLRSQFMSKSIKPGQPLIACGVSVGGLLVGAFALLPPKFDPACVYLMSDFPVSWSRYRRLSKLIVLAGLSKESRQLAERSLAHRMTSICTTAFSDRPNSAKYGRGIPGFKLTGRTEPAADGVHRYQLQYEGPYGERTLAEALELWRARHAGDIREQ
ncbi:putative antirestriction adenine methyltransferase [Streptomyces yaizuensis]|uniref:Uncharacterized protein n=1 Tax=Streptomyces yaizuensis TaxID=2989713 RepID=A0AA86MBG8_9ACTN|nr:hypothetical protein [Streptomyces sp. YSPA8]BDT39503.1 hypothetical protein SYYSPA8_36925 [Streptomyces sp. YSPA8]